MKMRNCFFITAFVFTSFVFAQSTIQGTVSDESGGPLYGANVTVEGTAHGGASDEDGHYMINIPTGTVDGKTVVVTASYIGYKSNSVSINVPVAASAILK